MARDSRRGRGRRSSGSKRTRAASESSPAAGATPETGRSALRENLPILRFVALFLGALVVFQFLYYEAIVGSAAFDAYLGASAALGAGLCRLVGMKAEAVGDVLSTPSFSISIKVGCDGIRPMAVLVFGILMFAAPWRPKLLGVALGLGGLFAVNLVRISSLLWFGGRDQELFHLMHLHVWPGIMVALALTGFVGWALWVTSPGARDSPAASSAPEEPA